MTDRERTRLKLLGPGDALTGVAPHAFERASKTCRSGDATHRGLLRIAISVANHGLRRAIAPSVRPPLLGALSAARAWCDAGLSLKALSEARSATFNSIARVVSETLHALAASMSPLPKPASTLLVSHAESTVRRYVSLSAKLAADAVVLTLDGVTEPARLAEVVQQVAASRAYQNAGLGAARQPELLDRAREQANFELEVFAEAAHDEQQLSVQIWHEYLGVRWKVLHDAERAYIDEFVRWAFGGEQPAR